MNDDIKNKKLSKLAYDALTDHLLSIPGSGIAGGKDDQGVYSLDPQNMSFDDMEKARDFLKQSDATNNILGLARQQAGQDPVAAQEAQDFVAQTQQARPSVGGSALDLLREQNGFPASYQNRNIINRFQKPTKEEKKELKTVSKEKDKSTRTPAGQEQTMEAMKQVEEPGMDSPSVLGKLMGTQNENQLIADVLRGTERINAGLNLVNPDYNGVDALQKNAGQGVANFEKFQKTLESDLKLKKLQNEMDDDKTLSNPNSDISKLARDTMKSMGVNVSDDLSAGMLKASGVNIGSLLGIKESASGRKEVAKMYAQQKEDARKEGENLKREKIATLSDKQTESISGMDKAISHIENILEQKPNFETGPTADTRNKAAHLIGKDDPEVSAFRSSVGEQLATYIKSISGAAVSEPEARRLIANMPTMYDSNEVFTAKAQRLLNDLKNDKAIYMDSLKNQGKNLANFEPSQSRKPASSSNEHPMDKEAVNWAKKEISNPENAKDALAILKANGIL